jgi:acetolactate synthase-1/2/3 large subunit
MKLTDALAERLLKHGIRHVFGLQGGAVVHIFDSFERLGVGVTYTHHEQSAALAAAAYAKVTENIGCAVVTTGPGATNAITGLLGAWQDSVPCLFLSGQARTQHTSYGRKVRQVGTQEVNICEVVRPLTKYAAVIRSADTFLDELEKALSIARSGRPGPVWLDLPLDMQWTDINAVRDEQIPQIPHVYDSLHFEPTLDRLRASKKVLLVLGYGVRLSGCVKRIRRLVQQHSFQFVTTWTAADVFPSDDPLNLGIFGMSGQRGANKAVFEADTLLCLGTHLSIPHTTTLFDSYAPDAYKMIVNIDEDQLENLNVRFDQRIKSDLSVYLDWLYARLKGDFRWSDASVFKDANWYQPPASDRPNSNVVVRRFTELMREPLGLVVDGGGTALYAAFQSSRLKEADRIICSSAMSAMGTGLAESVGVAMSGLFSRQLCVIGDGSFLMNVQDLQTIRQNSVNVVILVVNNNGYLAIRQTQKEFLGGRYYGTHPDWKLPMPSISAIAHAFEIPHILLNRSDQIEPVLETLIVRRGPIICEVVVDESQEVLFKQGYKANGDGTFSPQSLKDMVPFMPT